MSDHQSFSIGLTCCFCAGRLEVDEASRTVRCPHCASLLKVNRASGIQRFVITEDIPRHQVKFHIDRHLKKASEPLASGWNTIDELYVPFWRIRGMACAIFRKPSDRILNPETGDVEDQRDDSVDGIMIRARDISFPANDEYPWGITTLGVRTQVVPLEPLDAEFTEMHRLMSDTVSRTEAGARFQKAADVSFSYMNEGGHQIRAMGAGLDYDLIYFPLWIAHYVSSAGRFTAQFDPVAGRVVSITDGDTQLPPAAGHVERAKSPVTLIAHRCANCGQDLPDSPRSSTYYCSNCRRLYAETERGYRPLSVRIPPGTERGDSLFPFWVFDMTRSNWRDEYDYPGVCRTIGFQDRQFIFPAFQLVNPQELFKLVLHYNRRENNIDLVEYPNRSYPFADCATSARHAMSMIPQFIRAALAARGVSTAAERTTEIPDVPEPELIWLPCRQDRYFWRERTTNAAITRAAVRVAAV